MTFEQVQSTKFQYGKQEVFLEGLKYSVFTLVTKL